MLNSKPELTFMHIKTDNDNITDRRPTDWNWQSLPQNIGHKKLINYFRKINSKISLQLSTFYLK